METRVSSGGGPFELEERLTFTVYDIETDTEVMRLTGGHDADYGGVGWNHTGSHGVVGVALEADGLVITRAGGQTQRYSLPLRKLESGDVLRLLEAHTPYMEARKKYLHAMGASEVPFVNEAGALEFPSPAPKELTEALFEAARPHWEALLRLTEELDLSEGSAHEPTWPSHTPGGEKRAAALRKWIEDGGFRHDGMRRYGG